MYWDNNARARLAYEKFMKQQSGALAEGPKVDEESWRDELIQVNVESVYCVWCTYMKGLHERLINSPRVKLVTMDPNEKKDPPKDEKGKDLQDGWVVEIRGYTYHKEPLTFLSKVVVENFRRLGAKTSGKSSTPGGSNATPGSPTPGQKIATAAQSKAPTTQAKAAPAGAAQQGAENAGPTPDDPITISHVVLFDYSSVDNATATHLSLADKAVVDSLTSGLEAPSDASAPKSLGIKPTGGGNNWSPLTSPSGGGDIVEKPQTDKDDTTQKKDKDRPLQAPERFQLMGGQPGMMGQTRRPAGEDLGAPQDPSKMQKTGNTRTEFVVVFVWREPTPSDNLKPVQTGPVIKKSMFGGRAVTPPPPR